MSVADRPAPSDEPGASHEKELPETTVVGLGASAGGLSALHRFFDRVPPNSGLAYVVVMHLSPDYESHLAEVLQTHSSLSVNQVTEQTKLEPDHVYVIPPNRNLATIDSHLRLSPLEEQRRERAPIDHFFRTLAATHDSRAVAVILSGTGFDGSIGLGQVKEAGGLTIVQDPDEAEHASMPRNAIATGQVDLVSPVAEIPSEILRYLSTEPTVAAEAETERDSEISIKSILTLLLDDTGHDFTPYKPTMLLRRISRRMQIAGKENLSEYLNRLRQDHSEVETLHHDLLIAVTNFFRDPETFAKLEESVIPQLFEDKGPNDEIRIWSVGCATGEEPYGLAMLLMEQASRHSHPPNVQVFASDASERALERAREGLYPRTIEADVGSERIERFFVQEPGGGYRVKKAVRERVIFARHNLLTDPPFAKLVFVGCRNLLIYLRHEVQSAILDVFHYALVPGGVLLLGSSETVSDGDRFRVVDKGHRLYRRQHVRSAKPRLPSFPLSASAPQFRRLGTRVRDEDLSYGAFHARLAERHGPPSLLVSSEHEIVHRSENAGRYLFLGGGEPSDDLLLQVRPELRLELRVALSSAAQTEQDVTSPAVPLVLDGEAVQVAIHVRPASEPEREGFLLVHFYEIPAGAGAEPGDVERSESAAAEGELEALRQRLRTVTQEHEGRDEEMRASNEELQSINEELRSTAEKLETSKEELQSMNEELVTINQENKEKVDELLQLTSDLNNLLGSTDIATLFLDRELRIRRFTPRVNELFNVVGADRGRPLGDFTHKLGYDLLGDARSVLENLQPIEREVKSENGDWYLLRLLPYRTVDDRIDGVVITLVDIAALKNAELRLKLLASQLTMAEQRERERIAHVLHDDVQQLLFSVMYRLQMLEEAGYGEGSEKGASLHEEELEEMTATIQRAIDATRTLATEMSPPVLKNEGLPAMLHWLAAHMRNLHELHVELDVAVDESLVMPREKRVLLFHSVRELLFNVVKHANVDKVRLEAFRKGDEVVLVVRDGGDGFDLDEEGGPGQGFGLATLRERLELLEGGLEVSSSPGQGTRAVVRLCVTSED